MIATILPSSANFHAIDYNEKKVAQGYATLVEMNNVYGFDGMGPYTPDELRRYFIEYSSRNDRIRKPQFHLAISCKGREYSVEQLRDIAHRYLEKMGYASDGQPVVMYAHHDTANTHIHIVTSRVAPDGHKIDHNHERRRSQRIIDEIMGVSPAKELQDAIDTAKKYDVRTRAHFRAVMSTMGYDSKIDPQSGDISFFKGGVSVGTISFGELEAMAERSMESEHDNPGWRDKRKRQIKALFKKYQPTAGNLRDFSVLMKRQFGIDLVLYGSKDSPYGYTIIDHKEKLAYNGKEVMGIRQLCDFTARQNLIDRALQIASRTMELDNFATTFDINEELARKFKGVYVKGKSLWIGREMVCRLPSELAEALGDNNRMAYAARYCPADEVELTVLQCALKRDYDGRLTDFIKAHSGDFRKRDVRGQLFVEVLDKAHDWKSFRESLHGGKFALVKEGTHYYIIDHGAKAICRADSLGIETESAIERLKLKAVRRQSGGVVVSAPARSCPGHGILGTPGDTPQSHSFSREWEVGQHTDMDDPDLRLKGSTYQNT